MKVEYVDFIVEEPSMEAFLNQVAPHLLGDIPFSIFPFQSKDEMLSNLASRLKGYKPWLPDTHYIEVIVDRDDDDCRDLKQRLEDAAMSAGLITRSQSYGQRFSVINRIAIEELEAWYFGDWEAVRAAYPRIPVTVPQQRGTRNPDAIAGGTWETFERIMQRSGYFKTGLRKIEAARAISANIQIDRNTSRSFQSLRDALLELNPQE